MSKAKFVLSPANIDSCSYASVGAHVDHNELALERLYRLIKDPKLKLDLKEVLVVTSSDEAKAFLLAQLRQTGHHNIHVESVTNFGFEDTAKFMNHCKYLFCVNISNFKATLIDNLMKWIKGKHLTITDTAEKCTKPLVHSRNKIYLHYGSLLKKYTIFDENTTKKSSKDERKEETKKEEGSVIEEVRKPKYTPSVELLRSIVDSSTLCSKVNKGLQLVHSQNQYVQLALQYLINPKNSTTFVILLSLMHLPNGKVLKREDLTSICNIIDKEVGITAFDFFKKYESHLANLSHLTNKLFKASEQLDFYSLDSISSSMEILLESMNQRKKLKTLKKDIEQLKKDYLGEQKVDWLSKLTTSISVKPYTNVDNVALGFIGGTKSDISVNKLRCSFMAISIKNETSISQNRLSVSQNVSFKAIPKIKGLEKGVKWLKRL